MLRTIFLLFLFTIHSINGKEKDAEISTVSEALGHLIGKNIQSLGLEVDLDLVIKGLKDESKGASSPLTEDECIQAIAYLQELCASDKAELNLKEANEFLSQNKKDPEVVEIEPNKIQYKIIQAGEGAIVKDHNLPVIRYIGKYLNGKTFGEIEEPEVVSIEETIPGFAKGLIGMKEGEKRVIFIHPDYGYGKSNIVEPNSLLTFEVELIKADQSHKEEITDGLHEKQKSKEFAR